MNLCRVILTDTLVHRIVAAPTRLELLDGRSLDVWAYNGQVPGPILRVRLGQRLRVEFENRLPQPTTIHWHGVRLPNAMDGVLGAGRRLPGYALGMARAADRLPENVPGDFYVDRTCIDCDLCRQLAPASFSRSDRTGMSFVFAQPADDPARHRALMALVTCPTASIGTTRKLDSRAAARAFPELLTGEIHFCGYASAASYGASSWLVRRPDGNVLVDSPRAARVLMDRVAALGGVRWMYLTHRDDVADHRAWRRRFGCERILHRDDVSHDTREVERLLDGPDPVRLAPDLLSIPVPGHTRGSQALLVGDTYLFTGDHLWASDDETGLEAGREVCWHSWPEQRRSVARLADHTFTWVLPGHGRPFHAAAATMRAEVVRLAASM